MVINVSNRDRDRASSQDPNDSDDRGSAFEAYKKPAMSTFGKVDRSQGQMVDNRRQYFR